MSSTCVNIELPDETASLRFAKKLADYLLKGVVFTFSGDIGSGKTTIIRALLRSLGITGPIKSPTFSLVESYQSQAFQVHHFDLYRIHDEEELEYIGFRDYFKTDSICCIEWPLRVPNAVIDVDLRFTLSVKGSGRLINIKACSVAGEKILTKLLGIQ